VTWAGAATLARCADPAITVKAQSGIPDAIASPCGGGVAGSCAPAITSVGAVIDPSTGRRSMPPIASQQPA
jgi:hypothetical protein